MDNFEKENKRLKVLIVILLVFLVAFGGYYFYINVIKGNDKNTSSNNELKEEVITENSADSELENLISDTNITNSLKTNFEKIYDAYSSPNTFCGISENANKSSADGKNYTVASTQFKNYNELYSYLSEYATTDVLSKIGKINKDFYLEEDGKLYCADLGKGGIYSYDNTSFEYKEITNDSIKSIVSVTLKSDINCSDLSNPTSDCIIYDIEKFNVTFTKNNDNWIISNFEFIK